MNQSMPLMIVMIIRFLAAGRFWGWDHTSVPISGFQRPSWLLPKPTKWWSEISFCSLGGTECWTGEVVEFPVCVSGSCYFNEGTSLSACLTFLGLPFQRKLVITRINYRWGSIRRGELKLAVWCADPKTARGGCPGSKVTSPCEAGSLTDTSLKLQPPPNPAEHCSLLFFISTVFSSFIVTSISSFSPPIYCFWMVLRFWLFSPQAWLTEIHEYAQQDVVLMLLGNKARHHGKLFLLGSPWLDTGLNIHMKYQHKYIYCRYFCSTWQWCWNGFSCSLSFSVWPGWCHAWEGGKARGWREACKGHCFEISFLFCLRPLKLKSRMKEKTSTNSQNASGD